MDRAAIQQRLMQAEAHVAESKRRIARQQKLVRTLEVDGLPSDGAKRLLAEYEQSHALHVANRDLLQKKLAGAAN
jgi:hypothetical protein